MKHQIGTYAFKITKQQLGALVDVLQRSSFPTLKSPERHDLDAPTFSVRLTYRDKGRTVTFPMRGQPIAPGFIRMWDELVAVLSRCKPVPQTALSLSLSVPKEGRRGTPVPVLLEIKNVGSTSFVIWNPFASEEDVWFHALVGVDKLGPDGKPTDLLIPCVDLRFRQKNETPLNPRLRPSETLRLRDARSFSLAEAGEYAVYAELQLSVQSPDKEDPPYGKWVHGRVFSNTCRVSIK